MTDGEFHEALKRERIKHGLDPQTGTPVVWLRVYVMTKGHETYVVSTTTQTPWNRIVDALASWVDKDELSFTADDAERFLDGVES